MWLTEFNYDRQSLEITKEFYQWATKWLDGLKFVERYALFGAFRSGVSNVGPNAAMLSDQGDLTDIGLWYLGRNGSGASPITGNTPNRQPLDVAGRGHGEKRMGNGLAPVVSALLIALMLFLFI